MLVTLVRVLIGFVVACLAAGATQFLFAYPPSEILAATPTEQSEILSRWLLASTQIGVFSAPFALVVAALAEWQGLKTWVYHGLAGVAIAVIGFVALFMGEESGGPTIVTNYAMAAFLASGLIGGLAFWLIAGRNAGGPDTQLRMPMPRPIAQPRVAAERPRAPVPPSPPAPSPKPEKPEALPRATTKDRDEEA